jgi:hypothetical protein
MATEGRSTSVNLIPDETFPLDRPGFELLGPTGRNTNTGPPREPMPVTEATEERRSKWRGRNNP